MLHSYAGTESARKKKRPQKKKKKKKKEKRKEEVDGDSAWEVPMDVDLDLDIEKVENLGTLKSSVRVNRGLRSVLLRLGVPVGEMTDEMNE